MANPPAATDSRPQGNPTAAVDVLVITGDLPRLAWHIGSHQTPCQIEARRLLISADAETDTGLAAMLQGLGAGIARAHEPFTPEAPVCATAHAHAFEHVHVHHHVAHHHPEEEEDTEPLPD